MVQALPAEQIQFVADGADEEAAEVVAFLTSSGCAPGDAHGLPAGILLDLAGMVRLRIWEATGLGVHLKAGLPTACEALEHVINILTAAAADSTELARAGRLGRAVFDLRMSQFAWAGPTEFGADVALDTPNSDVLIESLAKYLVGLPASSICG